MSFIRATLAILFGLILAAPAYAGNIQGTISYVHDWSNCSSLPGARNDCASTGTTKALRDLVINIRRVSDGGTVCELKTTSGGAYSCSLPGGSYKMVFTYRDGTITPGYGDAGVALVTSSAQPFTQLTDTVLASFSVPSSGTATVNYTVNASSTAQVRNRTRVFTQATKQSRTWENEYTNSWFDSGPGSLYRARIFDQATLSSTGLVCLNNNPFDCAWITATSFTNGNPETLWHESGHGMQRVLQAFLYGSDGNGSPNTWATTPRSADPCTNAIDTASRALEEGWADFVFSLTAFPPSSVPNGSTCGGCQYPATGAQPAAPRCGAGTIIRDRFAVQRALVDLVDAASTMDSCVTETLQLTPGTLLDALTSFSLSGSNSCGDGTGEGGVTEGAVGCTPATPSTPNFPYTGANALPQSDQLSLLDLLGILKADYGVSGTQLRNVWANSCWQPGDTNVSLP